VAIHGSHFRHGEWQWRNCHGVKIRLNKGKNQELRTKREEMVDGSATKAWEKEGRGRK